MQLPSLLFLLVATGGSGALTAECHIDFREGKFDNRQLRLTGADTAKLVRPEPEGLLMEIPAGGGVDQVGFAAKYVLHGDFEITASYELLDVAKPDAGYGVGPAIHIAASTKAENAATLSRIERPKEGSVYGAHVAWFAQSRTQAKRREHRVRLFDTSSESGRLRLARSGEMLQYLVADGESETFRQIHQVAFTDANVDLVCAALNRNGARTPATIRWKDFDLRAERISRFRRPSSGKGGLLGVGLCVTGVAGLLALWYWRRAKWA